MSTLCIEFAPFTLAPGLTEQDLFSAAEVLGRDFLSASAGYLGRALTRLADGRWADIVLWRSREDAAAAMERVSGSAACNAYFGCMVAEHTDAADHGVTLATAVQRYGLFRGL
jgi:hypothetical protein